MIWCSRFVSKMSEEKCLLLLMFTLAPILFFFFRLRIGPVTSSPRNKGSALQQVFFPAGRTRPRIRAVTGRARTVRSSSTASSPRFGRGQAGPGGVRRGVGRGQHCKALGGHGEQDILQEGLGKEVGEAQFDQAARRDAQGLVLRHPFGVQHQLEGLLLAIYVLFFWLALPVQRCGRKQGPVTF